MTKERMITTAAILITVSSPTAQAAIILPGSITVAELTNETLAKKTLSQLQASAAVVADEAGLLKIMANPTASPELHLAELGALKDDVNRMAEEIGSLIGDQDSLASWERQAMNQLLPLLQATVANTESAIDYFNKNRDHLWTEEYRDYTGRVSRDSEQIATILKNYLKYEKLREQESQVEERLWTESGG